MISIGLSAGCKKAAEPDKHAHDDGHDHAEPQSAAPDEHKHDEHGDHDDHDHGEGEAHADEVVLSAEAIERYGIKVQPARKRLLQATFHTPARVAFNAEATAHVGSPLPGRAIEIKARLGDAVKAGDVLLIVESPELGEAQAEYFQKRMMVETAAPGIELARVAWERAKGLHDQSQGISLTEVQRREAEYKAAIAAQKAAETAVIGVENRLHLLGMTQPAIEQLARTGEIDPRYTITAPIDAHVVQREVTLGEMVGPEREALMVLADTRTLWVLAEIPEARLHEVTIEATAKVTAGTNGAAHEGAVSYISPLVDPVTRTVQARIEVPAASLALRPGMFVQVELAVTDAQPGQAPEVIAVPDEAVQTVEGSAAVFIPVEGEPNTFTRRAITAGKPIGGLVPVLAGLSEGERYVAAGSFILKAELGKGSAGHQH
ncbi:MAG: efflux RND transporter periplasmic adaptor subunit [Phycisphaerales bacterium]|nr:efflux RND transporter periplasmic adaptor subunit [Phycisphaerales bacterium]